VSQFCDSKRHGCDGDEYCLFFTNTLLLILAMGTKLTGYRLGKEKEKKG
jgi:hypothetical protein